MAAEQPALKPVDRETYIWNFFIAQGYTRNQTSGIMGNLKQEHGYQTSDVAGGLGIAQWLDGRRAALMQDSNYLDLDVQLNFVINELNSSESKANQALKAAQSIEEATIAFQNKYERCGKCMQTKRVGFAYEIAAKF